MTTTTLIHSRQRVRFRWHGYEYEGRVTHVRRTRAEVTFMTKGDREARRLPHTAVIPLGDLTVLDPEETVHE